MKAPKLPPRTTLHLTPPRPLPRPKVVPAPKGLTTVALLKKNLTRKEGG